MWANTKKAGRLIKFGGGFYCAEFDSKTMEAIGLKPKAEPPK